MADINKIMCFCGCGLGTSLIMEMNTQTTLKEFGVDGVEVVHSTIDDVIPGAADLFVCANDMLHIAEKAGRAIGIKNMLDMEEYKEKLGEIFGR
ncbi:MAG: PTS sugar transporter subunit IIB [Coriobacteriia bacterium]|nr:PTS sugar transporter subunit IIB [Coriobacteriia bacterium]